MKISYQNNPFSLAQFDQIYNRLLTDPQDGLSIITCPRINSFFSPSQSMFFSQVWQIVESPTIAYCNNLVFYRKTFTQAIQQPECLLKVLLTFFQRVYQITEFALDLYPAFSVFPGAYQICINNIATTACFCSQQENRLELCLVVPHRYYTIFKQEVNEKQTAQQLIEEFLHS